MIRCDICGKTFIRCNNMLRHKRTIYGADDQELADKDFDSDFEHDEASFQEEETLDQEEDPWSEIIDEAFKECQSKFEDRVKDLMDSENMDQQAACSLAFKQLQSLYRKVVISRFVEKMLWYKLIKHDRVFQALKESVKQLVGEEDYDLEEAWKYASSKRKYLFENLFKQYLPPEVNDESKAMTRRMTIELKKILSYD